LNQLLPDPQRVSFLDRPNLLGDANWILSMKIAQVAPLFESVPPKLYGGTERIVSFLTEELVKQDHEVTLFASGDSQSAATLAPMCQAALRLQGEQVLDPIVHHIRMMELVIQQAPEFDVFHFHTDYLQFPLLRRIAVPAITTQHGRLDTADLKTLFSEFWDMKVVSISEAQREALEDANWVGNIYHGIPADLYAVNRKPDAYLAFLGRISPEKRVDRAIKIAKGAGRKLKIAAKLDRAEKDYFDREIKHLLDDPLVEFLGEIGEDEKQEFLGKAEALLFPIDWPEPFGLVLIEAMACGTPVIAYPFGSVPELIDDGQTGFLVKDIGEAVSAVHRIEEIDRVKCRQVFDNRFTAARMASDYVELYGQLTCGASVGIDKLLPRIVNSPRAFANFSRPYRGGRNAVER
jgi:glycosyltransferase involved in cell wall biosynthesis